MHLEIVETVEIQGRRHAPGAIVETSHAHGLGLLEAGLAIEADAEAAGKAMAPPENKMMPRPRNKKRRR